MKAVGYEKFENPITVQHVLVPQRPADAAVIAREGGGTMAEQEIIDVTEQKRLNDARVFAKLVREAVVITNPLQKPGTNKGGSNGEP